jgi:asparagine synthase (glutamine-hydrolysing)
MCGVSGSFGFANRSELKTMMESLSHRGPDAEGIFISDDETCGLGHTRLSIMDPEGGNQPIYNETGDMVIVANGEIYNFPRLKPELAKDHIFSTVSDSEIILHLFEERGPAVINHLDGMYAFAIYDGENLFAARDPLGIKPLYFGRKKGHTYFASELKALSKVCNEIEEMPPGTYYHSKKGFRTFYQVPDTQPDEISEEYSIELIKRTLEDCVVKRLMSDVPLGAFLSGGLDSSIICALARKHLGRFHSFSIGTENSRDLAAARNLSQYLDTIHHEYIITADEVIQKLPEIIYHLESFDQDLVRSAIPCYFTSRLAAENVKVILTGEGADELFAGYSYYKDIRDSDVLHNELRRSVQSLHNVNLQRVDRMTMAHSIEGRVPFLDRDMIKLGLKIPTHLKLRGRPPVEKWILRKAFEDILPEEIVWRVKEQFDEGSGSVDMLELAISSLITENEAEDHRDKHPDIYLRSREECYYHKLFLEVFDAPEPVLANVGRWADRPDEVRCS